MHLRQMDLHADGTIFFFLFFSSNTNSQFDSVTNQSSLLTCKHSHFQNDPPHFQNDSIPRPFQNEPPTSKMIPPPPTLKMTPLQNESPPSNSNLYNL